MFGLGALIIILIYVFLAVSGAAKIKKGIISHLTYWGIVVLFPVWFFAGHLLYPSYFKFKNLCESDSEDTYVRDKKHGSIHNNEWIVPGRLYRAELLQIDNKGEVAGKRVDFYYYPFGSEAKLMGGASGSAPRTSCPRQKNA